MTLPELTLPEMYESSKKLLLRAREGLETLEMLEYTMGMDSPDESLFFNKNISEIHSLYKLSLSIKTDIFLIQPLCTDMRRLCHSVDAESQPDLWKRKVEHVVKEAEYMEGRLDKYNLRNESRMRAARENAEFHGRANGDPARVLRIFDKEAQTLQSDYCYDVLGGTKGKITLSKYSEQREHLKMAQPTSLATRNKAHKILILLISVLVLWLPWYLKKKSIKKHVTCI